MICDLNQYNPKMKRVLVFFNGFGANCTFWDNLKPYFSDYSCVLLSENYFKEDGVIDEQRLKEIFEGKEVIGIGHSLGYMKLCLLQEKYKFFNLKKVVSIEGFSNYLSDIPYVRETREFGINYMKICYAIDSILTLISFQAMCGAVPLFPKAIDEELLQADLELLREKVTPPKIPHLVLSSADDPIIPCWVIEDNFRSFAKILYTQFAGHILGINSPEWVFKNISEFIYNAD